VGSRHRHLAEAIATVGVKETEAFQPNSLVLLNQLDPFHHNLPHNFPARHLAMVQGPLSLSQG
jgi:hypothetical protein